MSVRLCSHLKSDAVVCGSPALRGKTLCYFHQRDVQRAQRIVQLRARVRRRAQIAQLSLPPLDTAQGIQFALFDVLDALAANRIEPQRAGALLFGLQQASRLILNPEAA
jgi:hypothetical protein